MKDIEKLKKEVEQLKNENNRLKAELERKGQQTFLENPEEILQLFDNIYFKSSNQGIWDQNLISGKVVFNQRLAEILEINTDIKVLSNKELDAFIISEDLPVVVKARENHIKKKAEFFSIDYRIQTPKNNIKWIHSQGRIISYANDNLPHHIVGFSVDITERKELEQRLRTEEEKYKSFFLNSPLGAFKSTIDGKLVEINKEFARLFGYKSTKEAYDKIKDIGASLYANPSDRKDIIKAIKSKPGIHIYEVEFKKNDESSFVGRLIAKKVATNDGVEILEGHLEDISESKRLFNILLKSEEKFNQLANTISDIFWIIDQNHKLIYINKAFEHVFGRRIEEVIENPGIRIKWIYPDDTKRIEELIEQKLYEKGPVNEFFRIVKPDDQIRWIWGRSYPIFNDNGGLYRIVGVMSDVTEQKILENALLKSTKRISLLLEQTPLAYIEWNNNLEITNWNNAATEVFKYTSYEAIGQNIIDLIVPSYNRDYFMHLFNDLIEQKEGTKSTNENIDKDGNIVICDWYNNALIDNNGDIIGLASIIQDITARVNAEKEVDYSQNFFNTTFNAIPDYIHVIDEEMKIVFVNNAFQTFLRSLKLPIAKKGIPLDEVFPFLKARVFREYRQVFETGEELSTNEFTKIRGIKIYSETRKTPVFEEGRVKYIVTTVRDVTERVHAEQALRESEKRLQLAFDAANDGLWDFNPKTKEIFYFSPRWFSMLGYEPEDLPHTYETWSNLLHPEERINVENLIWDYINKKKDNFTIEFRMRNKSGQYQWILSRGEVVEFDEEGFPIRMVGTHVDISENKRMLNLLSHKEQQLSTLLENSKDSIVVLNTEGKIKFAGNMEARIIGEPVTELIDYNYFEYLHKEDLDVFKSAFQKSIHNPSELITVEYRSHFDTGELIYLDAILSNKTKTKGINGIVLNVRNITERKLSELKREELVKNQNILSQTAQDFLQIRSKSEIYKYITEKIIDLIGSPIVFIGEYEHNQVQNVHTHGIEKYVKEIRQLIGEEPAGFSIVLNDQRKKLLSSRKLIELKGGLSALTLEQLPTKICSKIEAILKLNKIYIIGFTRQEELLGSTVIITTENNQVQYPNVIETMIYQASVALERIALEDMLRISKEDAEKADKLKSAFLANMSHEIRTPMNAILGFADLLDDEKLSSKKRKEFIEIINSQGQQLLRLINDIIDISKIESGQVNIVAQQVNLNMFIQNIYQLYKTEVEKESDKRIALIADNSLPDEAVNIFMDEMRINQVFSNLINNALKYTKEGTIKFGYLLKEDVIEFYVEDTGIGVPKEIQKVIFERFRQADDTRIRKYGGTGLGLAICKGIIENMNGRIWVESNGKKGAKFLFTIPYYPITEKFIPKKINYNYKENYNWKGKKILIVEDDETSLLYLKTILKDTGIEIFSANTGKKAIELFKKLKSVDIALVDIQLPELSGLNVCEQFKKLNKNVKVIVQTAYAMPYDERICLKSGADDYITKPVKMTILKPLINFYLNQD